MVPVPSKNIHWARRYSSSKLEGFRKIPENPQILDSIPWVELTKVFEVTCSPILSQLKWSFFFCHSRYRSWIRVRTSYLVSMILCTKLMIKKLLFEMFYFLCVIQWVFHQRCYCEIHQNQPKLGYRTKWHQKVCLFWGNQISKTQEKVSKI